MEKPFGEKWKNGRLLQVRAGDRLTAEQAQDNTAFQQTIQRWKYCFLFFLIELSQETVFMIIKNFIVSCLHPPFHDKATTLGSEAAARNCIQKNNEEKCEISKWM